MRGGEAQRAKLRPSSPRPSPPEYPSGPRDPALGLPPEPKVIASVSPLPYVALAQFIAVSSRRMTRR